MACKLYMIAKGQDTNSCGGTLQTACNTLVWTLDLFYNGTHQYNSTLPSLQIVTDTDLMFNRALMVSMALFISTQVKSNRKSYVTVL